MDADAYLKRIEYRGTPRPNLETLQTLHRQHLLTVPFENLDIHRGRPIALDLDSLFDKIVLRKRGGFCYELNGLFATLLEELGFQVTRLSARVLEKGEPGPEFDHLTLVVALDSPWLADVGFGDSFLEPLRLEEFGIQEQFGRAYRLHPTGAARTLFERRPGNDWAPQYVFTLLPRSLDEFSEMCLYHQTSPRSTFTQKQVCTRATSDGRVTMSAMRLIISRHDERTERALSDSDEYAAALREHFGIILD